MSAKALGKRADLEQRAKDLRKNSTINTTFVLKQLFGLADGTTIDKEAIIRVLGKVIQKADTEVEVLTAGDATAQRLIELFDFQEDPESLWLLRKAEHRKLPSKDLQYMYEKLSKAGYDRDSEATSRIRIDLMMVEAIIAARELIKEEQRKDPDLNKKVSVSMDVDDSVSSTPFPSAQELRPSTPQQRKPQELVIYPELDLSVEIVDTSDADHPRKIRVTGKADWSIAYGPRKSINHGRALLAVKAKSKTTFSSARCQLLTYLVIMKHLRRQNDKINDIVQGFYSDGYRYAFMAIDHKNAVLESKVYDSRSGHDVHLIFSWIVSLVRTAAKSSPNTSPTKGDATSYNEIHDFNKNVFVKVYSNKHCDGEDGDEEDDKEDEEDDEEDEV